MNTFDKLKIRVPFNSTQVLKPELLEPTQKGNHYGEVKQVYHTIKHYNLPLGISWFRFDELGGHLDLEINSSILGPDYPRMLSALTFKQAIKEINKSGLIRLDYDFVYNTAIVLLLHLTCDLKLKDSIDKYLQALEFLGVILRYRIREIRKTTLEIYPNQIIDNNKMIIYNKEEEMKHSQQISKMQLREIVDLLVFKGVLRVEFKIVKHKTIRESFNIEPGEPLSLKRILESNENAGNNNFRKIFNTTIPEKINIIKDMSSDDTFKALGMAEYLRNNGHDENGLRRFIVTHPPKASRPIGRLTPKNKELIQKAICLLKAEYPVSADEYIAEILEALEKYEAS